MDTIIVICLLTIIVLLLWDKVSLHKTKATFSEPQSPESQRQNDIMGKPKVVGRIERQQTTNLERATDSEVLTGAFDETAISEEPWDSFEYPETDNDFSTSVTYDEIQTVAKVLHQTDFLEASPTLETINIVQKIHGTELFSLLESSIEGASEKIAELLERNIPNDSVSVKKLNKTDVDFDIGEFI